MGRPKNQTLTYKLHKPSNTARTWVGDRWVSLGRYGSPESKAEFARLQAEQAATPVTPVAPKPADRTVDQVLLAFWAHAKSHYRRPDDTPTQEISEYRQSLKIVHALYGHTAADQFGPVALKAVRAAMIEKGWARKLVNARVNRVRRVFKWAAAEQLVPGAVVAALAALSGLQKGRGAAPETKPVEPVAWEVVLRTLPHLRPTVRAMVEVGWLTGMRPGEVCVLRPCDIDASGAVWVYKPPYSKMSYKGKQRVVMIGPRAQEVLRRFTPAKPTDYYFSPADSVRQFHAERAASRVTPKYASHMRRNAERPKGRSRKPRAKYTNMSFGYAIRKAVARANAPLIEAGVELELHLPEWTPNQLRHAHATEVRHRFGLEAAQVVLGHERANTTEIYAEKNAALAARVASEVG